MMKSVTFIPELIISQKLFRCFNAFPDFATKQRMNERVMHLNTKQFSEKKKSAGKFAHTSDTKPKAPSCALAKASSVEKFRGKRHPVNQLLRKKKKKKRRIASFIKKYHFHSWPFVKAIQSEVAGAGKQSNCWPCGCSARAQDGTGCSVQKCYIIHWRNTEHFDQTLSSTVRYRNSMNRCRHLVKGWPSSAKACSIYLHEARAEERSSIYRAEGEKMWFAGYLSSSMMASFSHFSKYLPFSKAMQEPCTQTSKFSIKYGKDKLFPHFILYTVSSFQAYTLN